MSNGFPRWKGFGRNIPEFTIDKEGKKVRCKKFPDRTEIKTLRHLSSEEIEQYRHELLERQK